jgi:hypothetical protein
MQLQLFAMHQKITGQIDSTYTAQSHSLETLRDWHMQNSHVSRLVLSSQCIFPIFASIFLILYFIYLIESEPVNFGKKINSQADAKSPEIKHAAMSKVWIIVTISILFTIGTIATDIGAVVEYSYLPKEIESYIKDSSRAFIYLHAIPFIMLGFDFISLVLYIIVPSIVACCKCKFMQKCCKGSCCEHDCKFKVSDYLYTLISPLSCIATHSYHIIFAFINNPYHATSVLLFYIMTLFIVVVIFQKTYYFVFNKFFEKEQKSVAKQNVPHEQGGAVEGQEATNLKLKPSDQCNKGHGKIGVLVFSFILVIIALAICIGLTVAVLIALPINNAIDLASAEIYAIYQASVTVFAALVTFQVVFRPTNSIFAVFIKAADERHSLKDKKQENRGKWENMSEKEKEIHLGDVLLSHIDFKPPDHESSISASHELLQSANEGHESDIKNIVPSGSSVSAEVSPTSTTYTPPDPPRTPPSPKSEQPPEDTPHVPTGSSVSASPTLATSPDPMATPEPPQLQDEVPEVHNGSPQGQAMSASLSTIPSQTAPPSPSRALATSLPDLSQPTSKAANLSPSKANHPQSQPEDSTTGQHRNLAKENKMDNVVSEA